MVDVEELRKAFKKLVYTTYKAVKTVERLQRDKKWRRIFESLRRK